MRPLDTRRISEISAPLVAHNYVPSKKLTLATRRTTAAVEVIARCIYVMRGQKVMLDRDLAELYRVPTRIFNQAVKRNRNRFPADFMFELTFEETNSLRSQFVISKIGRGGRRYRPYAFTQEGVAMLSSVLRSPRAVQVNVAIMRAFVKLLQVAADYASLAHKLDELRCDTHDHSIKLVFGTLKKLFSRLHGPARELDSSDTTRPGRRSRPLIICAGYGRRIKKARLSTCASIATSKKPIIISSQLCGPKRTASSGSGLLGLFRELS